MNGNNIFLDTNIVLYLVGSSDVTIAELLNGKNLFISFITELELLGYKEISKNEVAQLQGFLRDVTIVDINSDIKKAVVDLRKIYKIKLPDAIIAASASYLNFPLLTADKALSRLSELNILLYEK